MLWTLAVSAVVLLAFYWINIDLGEGAGEGFRPSQWSLFPPVLALIIAFISQRILLALFAAVYAGGIIAHDGNLWLGLKETVANYIWSNVASEFNLLILFFFVSLVGMIGVANRSGATADLVRMISKIAHSARSACLSAMLMGCAVFFDDYSSCILVGMTMRPLTDRFKVSREKLSFIVDSTSAPLAGFAIISTWIGFEVGLFQSVIDNLKIPTNGYEMFFRILPFRFYCFFTLIFVFLNTYLRRDFGSMLRAERRAFHEGKLMADDAEPPISQDFMAVQPKEGVKGRWYHVALPIFLVIFICLGGILFVGKGSQAMAGIPFSLFSFETWRACFIGVGEIENSIPLIMFTAGMAGSFLVIFFATTSRILTLKESFAVWIRGCRGITLAAGLIILAWALKSVCYELKTANVLVFLLQDALQAQWIPLLTFILGALISFFTGTSWGAMGILIPIMGPLAYAYGDPLIFALSLGAILDGSIFGDHCSPISDTTVLSSVASDCDHIDHVRTQMPYALFTMSVASVCGYLWAAFKLPIWVGYLLGIGVIVAVLFLVGRPVELSTPRPRSSDK